MELTNSMKLELTQALLASFDSGTTVRRIANRALVARLQKEREQRRIPVAMDPE